jgi:tRNA threonylcarbamoyl adenosine modification protein (Sua5/YciO/YrdC/YwlC family)
MSEVFDCTTPDGLAAGIEAAARAVQSGQVVVLPTDTVYGIGCDAFDAAAVTAVLAAKGRGRDMPPPVLVPNARTVDGLARSVPGYVRHLIDRFWPGALTIVLESQPSLSWDLGETNGTVALRMPDHEIALSLLGQAGPMAVTSANLTGRPPAQTVAEAQEQLGASVAVYLDGGPASGRPASTILDCTGTAPLTLRQGALTRAEIDLAIDEAEKRDSAEAARKAAIEAAALTPPRKGTGPRIAGSRRRGGSADR